jgi:hypothetical protein
MENFFSRFGLDIIGKAVFNYDFDSLTHDDPVIQVCDVRVGVLTQVFWGVDFSLTASQWPGRPGGA